MLHDIRSFGFGREMPHYLGLTPRTCGKSETYTRKEEASLVNPTRAWEISRKTSLRFPPGARIATIAPNWRRDKDGAIVAAYERGLPMFEDNWTLDELETCMAILEASEQCCLSRQKKDDIVEQAMGRFGARAPEGF